LILDCYNANPSSMKAALESFAQIPHERKIAILGDMLELGAVSEAEHSSIIETCNELSIPVLTVGIEFEGVNKVGHHYRDTSTLIASTVLSSFENYLILIKGSRGIGLEQVAPLL
jgi:UDP-N-acetylmuramoyl-tripeptide--D-alanyl-D-alanine ligase